VLIFRGTIVAAYGYVETKLAEIAVRASRLAAYSNMRPKFPYQMNRRRAFLKAVFASGPLAQYSGMANAFLDRFEASSDLRHMKAHAHMELGADPKGWGVTFHDYTGVDGDVCYRRRRVRLAELEHEAWCASRFSRLCQRLYHRLGQIGILPASID